MNVKLMTAVVAGVLLCLGTAFAQDEEDQDTLGRIYTVYANHGEGGALEDGWKAYRKCYLEHGGKMHYSVWWRETDTLGVYGFVTLGHKWADFDGQEEASEACDEIFYGQFLPHVHKAKSEFVNAMPDLSHPGDGDWNVVQLYYFNVSDNRAFMDGIGKISEAAKAQDWGHFAWYGTIAGGHHAEDYFVAVGGAKFADWDADNMPLWEMVAKHHGKDKAEKIRAALNDVIDDDWSNIFQRRSDLEMNPEEEE